MAIIPFLYREVIFLNHGSAHMGMESENDVAVGELPVRAAKVKAAAEIQILRQSKRV